MGMVPVDSQNREDPPDHSRRVWLQCCVTLLLALSLSGPQRLYWFKYSSLSVHIPSLGS